MLCVVHAGTATHTHTPVVVATSKTFLFLCFTCLRYPLRHIMAVSFPSPRNTGNCRHLPPTFSLSTVFYCLSLHEPNTYGSDSPNGSRLSHAPSRTVRNPFFLFSSPPLEGAEAEGARRSVWLWPALCRDTRRLCVPCREAFEEKRRQHQLCSFFPPSSPPLCAVASVASRVGATFVFSPHLYWCLRAARTEWRGGCACEERAESRLQQTCTGACYTFFSAPLPRSISSSEARGSLASFFLSFVLVGFFFSLSLSPSPFSVSSPSPPYTSLYCVWCFSNLSTWTDSVIRPDSLSSSPRPPCDLACVCSFVSFCVVYAPAFCFCCLCSILYFCVLFSPETHILISFPVREFR